MTLPLKIIILCCLPLGPLAGNAKKQQTPYDKDLSPKNKVSRNASATGSTSKSAPQILPLTFCLNANQRMAVFSRHGRKESCHELL